MFNSLKKFFIALLSLASLILTCVGLSCCASAKNYAESIVKAQNKTELLKEFEMNLSASVKVGNVSVVTKEQYICYGTGENRRIYEKIDTKEAYYVGNLKYTFSGKWCSGCQLVSDSEINKKPFTSEKISDFEGATVDRISKDGNYVYTATMTEEILFKQLEKAEVDLPSDVDIQFNSGCKCIYTVNKKTGYLVEYSIPDCAVTCSSNGVLVTIFLNYNFSINTDASSLKIDYPETFEEYEKYYSGISENKCFLYAERYDNPQTAVNVWENESELEKRYNFDSIIVADCDSKTGAVAIGYFDNETRTTSRVDVYDKDMAKVSTFHFYGTLQSLSIENDKLAVSLSKEIIGQPYTYSGFISVFDLATNDLIYEAEPEIGSNWKVVLYGNAVACYDNIYYGTYIYNFSSGQTIVPDLPASDNIYGYGLLADGKLAILQRDWDSSVGSICVICEVDDEGVVSEKYRKLPPQSFYFNGTYWYTEYPDNQEYDYYVNLEEVRASLGVENFTGADFSGDITVKYYDGQYAIVTDNNKAFVCDLQKEEVIYSCTHLYRTFRFYKAGENCWYCKDGYDVYKLDISSLVDGN